MPKSQNGLERMDFRRTLLRCAGTSPVIVEFTLGVEAASIRKFDVFRKKRNITDYERADTISDAEA